MAVGLSAFAQVRALEDIQKGDWADARSRPNGSLDSAKRRKVFIDHAYNGDSLQLLVVVKPIKRGRFHRVLDQLGIAALQATLAYS